MKKNLIFKATAISILVVSMVITTGCNNSSSEQTAATPIASADIGTPPTDMGTPPTDMGTRRDGTGTPPTGTIPANMGTRPTGMGTPPTNHINPQVTPSST